MHLPEALRAIAFTVLASTASAQGVRIVDTSGARNFDTLQQAIDASIDGDPGESVPFDLDFLPRFMDLLAVPNTGQGTLRSLDVGCYENQF